jgi:hypothetical protein
MGNDATTITLDGKPVPVSRLGELDERDRVALERLLADPEKLDQRCRQALLDPALAEGDASTALYASHHLEQLPEAVRAPGTATPTVLEGFVRAMRVRSIWADAGATAGFLHVD